MAPTGIGGRAQQLRTHTSSTHDVHRRGHPADRQAARGPGVARLAPAAARRPEGDGALGVTGVGHIRPSRGACHAEGTSRGFRLKFSIPGRRSPGRLSCLPPNRENPGFPSCPREKFSLPDPLASTATPADPARPRRTPGLRSAGVGWIQVRLDMAPQAAGFRGSETERPMRTGLGGGRGWGVVVLALALAACHEPGQVRQVEAAAVFDKRRSTSARCRWASGASRTCNPQRRLRRPSPRRRRCG